MTTNPNKVLACVDQSIYADYIADYATWAAMRLSAPLEFLHVLDRHPEIAKDGDRSGALGVDAREHLLAALANADEVHSKAAREQGRIFLNTLRERALEAGITAPDIRQRHGNLAYNLLELESDVRLFVLGRRGQSAASTHRDLGRNVERVVRQLHKPILTVTTEFRAPQRVMLAFDGSIVTRRGVELVANSPLFKGISIHLLMSGKASQQAARQLEWATGTLEKAGFTTSAALTPGDAETIIARTILEQETDLLIMGAYSHSPLRSALFGSKTSDLLRTSGIPTMLLR